MYILKISFVFELEVNWLLTPCFSYIFSKNKIMKFNISSKCCAYLIKNYWLLLLKGFCILRDRVPEMTIYQCLRGSLTCHWGQDPLTEDYHHFKWSSKPLYICMFLGSNPATLYSYINVLPLGHTDSMWPSSFK